MSITTELGAQKLVPGVSYFASFFTAVGSAVSTNDVGILIGVLCAVATAIANWVYQSRKDKREAQISLMKAELIRKQLEHIENDR